MGGDDSAGGVGGTRPAPVFRPWCWGPGRRTLPSRRPCPCCEGRHLLLETRLQGESQRRDVLGFTEHRCFVPLLVAPPRTHCAGDAPRMAGGSALSCGGAACSGWKYKTDLLLKSIACHAGPERLHPGRWQLVDTAPRAHGSGDTARTAQPASQHGVLCPQG